MATSGGGGGADASGDDSVEVGDDAARESGSGEASTGAGDAPEDDAAGRDSTADSPAETGVDEGVMEAADENALDQTSPDTADAGSILTITGGSSQTYGPDAGVCSVTSGPGINFDIVNDRSAAIQLFWVNFSCGEQSYGIIQSGGMQNQMTYVGHVWRVRDNATQVLLGEFSLTAQANYTVTVN